ncbi:MAG: signal peptidase I [Candidatus Micrarchaeota archaeon]|nr:signal peptidase I [Candidatus Micrarchaeota archaeon]
MDVHEQYFKGPFGSLFSLLLGIAAAFIILKFLGILLHTETPVISVVSCSMFPELNRGDVVIVSGAADYDIGDIIVYRSPRVPYPIIHRIIDEKNGRFLTKGDNNPAPDGWIEPSAIMGKAIFKLPALGWPKILLLKLTGSLDQPIELCKPNFNISK